MKVGAVQGGYDSEEEEMEGGRLPSAKQVGRQITNAFKQAAPKNVRRGFNKLGDAIKKTGLDKDAMHFINHEGVDALSKFQKAIPRGAIVRGLQAGSASVLGGINALTGIPTAAAIGVANRGIETGVGSAIDGFQNTNFHKKGALKQLGRNLKGAYQQAATEMVTGGKLVKGSPEMKAHMARLRAMRKPKAGATSGGSVRGMAACIERKVSGRGMVPLGGGMVPL
jgi:hypothetical protein